jgi:chromosome partitioning protein
LPKIISSVNLKGGVGKTTLAVQFSAYLGTLGKKTLLIDLDPQTNATFSCISLKKWSEHAKKHGTVADLLGAKNNSNASGKSKNVQGVILNEVFDNVDLIPSHLDLFSIDLDMASAPARETRLRKAVKPILEDYDYVVCDCPPNLTIPTQNAIALSTHYVVPISPDFLSSLGVGILLSRITDLSGALESDIKLAGMVVSRVGRPAISRAVTVEALRKQFKSRVLQSEIKERAKVSEAAAKNKTIFEMNDNAAATEFKDMCKELLGRLK